MPMPALVKSYDIDRNVTFMLAPTNGQIIAGTKTAEPSVSSA
jgi:hypothetical protein